MKKRTFIIALTAAALSLAALPLVASANPGGACPAEGWGPHGHGGPEGQRGGPDGHAKFSPEQRANFKKKMQARFSKLLREKMQLPDATAQQVETLVRANMGKKKPLHQQMRTQRKALHKLLKEDSNDQQAYADALDGLKKTRTALRTLHEAQIAELQKLLTPKQQAQLLAAHHQMRKHMGRGGRGGKRGMHKGKRDGQGRRAKRGPAADAPTDKGER